MRSTAEDKRGEEPAARFFLCSSSAPARRAPSGFGSPPPLFSTITMPVSSPPVRLFAPPAPRRLPSPFLLGTHARVPALGFPTSPPALAPRPPTNAVHLGHGVATDIAALGRAAEETPPRLASHDLFGNPSSELKTCEAWSRLRGVVAEEGVVATGHDASLGPHCRVVQAVKLMLFGPSSGLSNCPAAMTDGAAVLCRELLGGGAEDGAALFPARGLVPPLLPGALRDAVRHVRARLLSRRPDLVWASGQWMTEKGGGSDVARSTETVAVPAEPAGPGGDGSAGADPDAAFRRALSSHALHGVKFFTSAADGEVAFALARDAEAGRAKGGRAGSAPLSSPPADPSSEGAAALPVSMYLVFVDRGQEVYTREEAARLGAARRSSPPGFSSSFPPPPPRGIQLIRLKDKLGTRQLPTAELRLDAAPAARVSPPGRGIASIAPMLEITRFYNAAAAAGTCRRAFNASRAYARVRHVFGSALEDKPLAIVTLADLEVKAAGSEALVLEVARLLGWAEARGRGGGTSNEREETAGAAPNGGTSNERGGVAGASPGAGAAPSAPAPPPSSLAPSDALSVLRLLTPLAKLFTAKEAVSAAAEAVEFYGGAGYLEPSGLPALLRDAMVLPIWEGTTNVQALDVLRVAGKDPGVAGALRRWGARALEGDVRGGAAVDAAFDARRAEGVVAASREHLSAVADALQRAAASLRDPRTEASARELAFALSEAVVGALLAQHALVVGERRAWLVAEAWGRRRGGGRGSGAELGDLAAIAGVGADAKL